MAKKKAKGDESVDAPKCCCCCHVAVGTVIICLLSLAIFLAYAILSSINEGWGTGIIPSWVFFAFVAVLYLTPILGLILKCPCLFWPYIIFTFLYILLRFGLAVMTIVGFFLPDKQDLFIAINDGNFFGEPPVNTQTNRYVLLSIQLSFHLFLVSFLGGFLRTVWQCKSYVQGLKKQKQQETEAEGETKAGDSKMDETGATGATGAQGTEIDEKDAKKKGNKKKQGETEDDEKDAKKKGKKKKTETEGQEEEEKEGKKKGKKKKEETEGQEDEEKDSKKKAKKKKEESEGQEDEEKNSKKKKKKDDGSSKKKKKNKD